MKRTGDRTSGFSAGLGSAAGGLLGAGVFTYVFLSLAGRVLGPNGFAPISTLWAMVFIVGPGLFMPMQQELGRVVAAHRGDRAGGTATRRAAVLAAGIGIVVIIAGIVASHWIVHVLLSGHWSLFWCFEASVVSWGLAYVTRGVFSGLGDFRQFGQLIATEAFLRLPVVGVFALFGVRGPVAFGVAIAAAPLCATAFVSRFGRRLALTPGPEVRWSELTHALGWLLAGSLLGQFLANAGPLAIQVLATHDQKAEAGRFLSALVIARIGFYLFQAVQATILPNLAELAARRQLVDLEAAIRRLVIICGGLVVLSTLGGLIAGPLVVHVLFGHGFVIGAVTMAILAGASAVYILAAALSSAAIAASGHRLAALAWLVGSVAFVLGTAVSHDLFVRVEVGYLIGSSAAAAVLLIWLPRAVRRSAIAEPALATPAY